MTFYAGSGNRLPTMGKYSERRIHKDIRSRKRCDGGTAFACRRLAGMEVRRRHAPARAVPRVAMAGQPSPVAGLPSRSSTEGGAVLRLAALAQDTRLSRMACHERRSEATESSGAGGGNRTHTGCKPNGILSYFQGLRNRPEKARTWQKARKSSNSSTPKYTHVHSSLPQ